MSQKLKVGITHGDINGIGYEVILKVLEDNRMLELCTPIVYGSAKIVAAYRKMLQLPNVVFAQVRSAAEAREDANNIINVVGEEVRPACRVPKPARLLLRLWKWRWPTSNAATLMCW